METRLIVRTGHWVRRNAPVVVWARNVVTAPSMTSRDWDTAQPYNKIPGPKPLPILGNAWRFVPRIGDLANLGMIDMTQKFLKDFGKIARLSGIPGRKDMLMVYDPDDIEKVFRNDGVWPIREGLPSFEHYRNVTRREFY